MNDIDDEAHFPQLGPYMQVESREVSDTPFLSSFFASVMFYAK